MKYACNNHYPRKSTLLKSHTVFPALPKLPDLDFFHSQSAWIAENLVCHEPPFLVPSSSLPGYWKALFFSLTDTKLPNWYQTVLCKSINRKILSTVLPNPTTTSTLPWFAYQKIRSQLNKEVHFMSLNKGQRMEQCISIVKIHKNWS